MGLSGLMEWSLSPKSWIRYLDMSRRSVSRARRLKTQVIPKSYHGALNFVEFVIIPPFNSTVLSMRLNKFISWLTVIKVCPSAFT